MPETTIVFADQDELRTLFGTRDEYLRQVRESVGIDVVVRDGELRLRGEPEQLEVGVQVFGELRAIIARKGRLLETEVRQVLDQHRSRAAIEAAGIPGSDAMTSIDLYEKSRRVHVRSPGQARYVNAIRHHDMVFASGPAGSGKTFLAVAMAIHALRTQRVQKIVLVRPAVEAGEKLGFLPGDMLAKVNPYLRPLLDALNDLLDFEQVKRYMESDVIEIVPLAFMRGRTLNHTFIILDEGQNTTITQMKMFLTRMGIESKIVVTGDITQLDLPENVPSGLTDAIERLNRIDGVATVALKGEDIVRHRLVREVVKAYDEGDKSAVARK